MIRAITAVSAIIALFYGAIFIILMFLNKWLLLHSIFGITFIGVDIRVWFLAFVSIIFGIWAILEIDDYIKFKKWRRSWK